jgi:hypothetical protein
MTVLLFVLSYLSKGEVIENPNTVERTYWACL